MEEYEPVHDNSEELNSETVGSDAAEVKDLGDIFEEASIDAKEELPQFLRFLCLAYGFTAEMALMGLVRWDSTSEGNTGSVERDVVKDVKLKTGSVGEVRFANEDQRRLMAEGNDGRWNTTGHIVHSDLML